MPEEKIQCLPNHKLMSPIEIVSIAETFVKLGINKIRLTGGEPLLRKDFAEILEGLSSLQVKLTLTTNGFWADRYVDLFKKTGVKSLNISIDSLDREKFFAITKRDHFETVWSNILLMINEGFDIKLNIVLMKNVNDDEINNFINLTERLPVHVRFIEFMPFDKNNWERNKVISLVDILENLYQEYDIVKLIDEKHDTAKKFKVSGFKGTFAFITTMSQPFCVDCNRLRLTADGKIKNCLFGKDELDLLSAFREGKDITNIILTSVALKHFKMGGQFEGGYLETSAEDLINRSMIKIGG
jgi:molybdenum cofactor biosynthesis enzyme MoaA